MEALAAAIAIVALCAWDIGRRHVSGVRETEREAFKALSARVDTAEAKQDEHNQSILRHDRQLTDLRGTPVESRRPRLTGVRG